ncbi:s-adenosyl-l-methionine-dependent methyltransferase [Ceraceosorus bombacis]|uniref:S-adenosyl-l-methionine-dependent methyltransferase n=1 Tax=Ceraceosorus bombacis TaxID=401625 RepID=A0A0P1BAT2_9BASI|nr:s-adenosyl-l-methionine-dependent methyltransferase [Ceraceosorus bombacis]
MDYAYELLDRGYLPDFLVRRAIRLLNAQRLRTLELPQTDYAAHIASKLEYVRSLKTREIAVKTENANEQHYEVDTGFMLSALGKHGKYSCCLYENGNETLDEAEEAMMISYTKKAHLKDGQKVLDLGCGWGSLSLWLAARYPKSQISSLSNSKTQKVYIDQEAKKRGINNLTVFTGDVKTYEFEPESFDRVISIEMFEHMKNYSLLLAKVSSWLKAFPKDAPLEDRSLLFIHIFCHITTPYHFETGDGWMTKHFFEGGTMASHDLFLHFQNDVVLEDLWWINGTHYGRTSEDWLKTLDRNNKDNKSVRLLREDAKKKGLDPIEGEKAFYRWRTFYLAVAEFFATDNGQEWGVGHYLFSKR